MLRYRTVLALPFVASLLLGIGHQLVAQGQLQRIPYNNPGLVVDLGVGLWAWPLPMDFDRDGDLDLIVSCPDKPYNGIYLFENPGAASGAQRAAREGSHGTPVFKPARRLAPALKNVQASYIDNDVVLMTPGVMYLNFPGKLLADTVKLPLPEKIDPQYQRYRANQWKLVDYDNDGDLDVIIGIGIWDDYGWDDAWNSQGIWTNGPLHGYVYLVENISQPDSSSNSPDSSLRSLANATFADPVKLTTTDKQPIDVYGMPSPNFADFDGDGDLDLVCGEFMDGFTFFENTGTRAEPEFEVGKRLLDADGQLVHMDLQMITPVAIDWDGDGDTDLICGDEDGRVALVESAGSKTVPVFHQPRYFPQQAEDVKFGALVTPVCVDWDGDGDEDLICGNTAGYLGLIENLGGGDSPVWAAPRRLREVVFQSGGTIYGTIRYEAGPQGSIQGPCEAKWGYTAPCVADWNQDGQLDIVVNDIWGKVNWHERKDDGELLFPQSVKVPDGIVSSKPEWTWWNPQPGELVTQWRTTPCVIDWNQDGVNDLVMLDHEGYLAFHEGTKRNDEVVVSSPKRIFKMEGPCEFDSRQQPVGDTRDGLLRLNANRAGGSGRRKLCFADWDGDGRIDLLVNSTNVNWLRNVRTDEQGFTWFRDEGPLDERVLAGHTTSPTVVDWDQNGIPDLLVGAEDGFLYYEQNPRALAAAGAQGATGGLPARGRGPVVTSEFIYESAPFPECHASTIEETPDGLVTAWFGGTEEGDKDVGIWVSRQVDGRWTSPVEVADGVQHADLRHPCWNPVLFQQPDGPLQLYYKCGPSPSTWWGMLTESTDHGQTWSWPRRLPETIDGPVKNKPVLLQDGTLLCGSSTEHDGWRVHFETTGDSGRTWQRIGPINDGKEFSAIQPTILTHGDGTLQILCRSREGSIVESRSADAGHTWSALQRTSLPNPNSGIDAVTLDDGRHLLVYNHTLRGAGEPRGRSLLNVAISENGNDWQAALVLENEPGGEFSYPAVIQTGDGLVHILYTWKRQRLRHVVVDPAKLDLQPIEQGRWPGLPDAGVAEATSE